MFPSHDTVDLLRMSQGKTPTPDALMVALLEQQKMLEKKDVVLEEKRCLST